MFLLVAEAEAEKAYEVAGAECAFEVVAEAEEALEVAGAEDALEVVAEAEEALEVVAEAEEALEVAGAEDILEVVEVDEEGLYQKRKNRYGEWARREKVDARVLSEWEVTVTSIVKDRIKLKISINDPSDNTGNKYLETKHILNT